MLDRVDRMQIAVKDRAHAAETFAKMLGAQTDRESFSKHLNARRTVMRLGESELELCEPAGAGPVQAFIDRWGEGLFAAGYASTRLEALAARLLSLGVPFTREDGQLHLPGSSTFGFPMVISTLVERERIGPVSFFYEATNTLATDWHQVAARYSELFDIDASRFSPIASKRFGYEGTLTLFNPPARLDRIELSQTFADQPSDVSPAVTEVCQRPADTPPETPAVPRPFAGPSLSFNSRTSRLAPFRPTPGTFVRVTRSSRATARRNSSGERVARSPIASRGPTPLTV